MLGQYSLPVVPLTLCCAFEKEGMKSQVSGAKKEKGDQWLCVHTMLLIPRNYWTSWESNPGPFAYTGYANWRRKSRSHALGGCSPCMSSRGDGGVIQTGDTGDFVTLERSLQ